MAAMKKISTREILTWVGLFAMSMVVAYSVMQGQGGAHNHGEMVGVEVGDLKLMGSSRGEVIDMSQKRGRVVVLNVYATWCPPCRAEIPDFSTFHADMAKAGAPVDVYGVVYESGPLEEALAVSKKLGVTYPVLLGNPTLVERFGLHIYPTTLVINPSGVVTGHAEGQVDYNWLSERVSEASAPGRASAAP